MYSKDILSDGFIFVLFNTCWGIYSNTKESKYTVLFLSIYSVNIFTLILVKIYYIYYIASSFFLSTLSLSKMSLNLGLWLKCLVISILLKGWSNTKTFYKYDSYYYIPFLLSWHLFQLSWFLFKRCLLPLKEPQMF